MGSQPPRIAFQDKSAPACPPRRPRLAFSRDETPGPQRIAAAPPRILVVEDDFMVSLEAENALIEAGFAVAGTARSAEEAVELARREHPALVVMDIRLAGARDGVDAAIEIFRELGLRSVFATAHSDSTVRQRAAPAAPLGWLQKPYTTLSLVEAVRQALKELSDPR